MSTASSSRKLRTATACQIAKDPAKFGVWSSFQNLAEGSYEDLPVKLKKHADDVFDVFGKLPLAWVQPDAEGHSAFAKTCEPKFVQFLREAQEREPHLFGKQDDECLDILRHLQTVFSAWENLQKLRKTSRKCSEAEYALQVYSLIRVPVGRCSEHRSQCLLSLPQPFHDQAIKARDLPCLNARTVRPDGAIFVPPNRLERLWRKQGSPYQVLTAHPQGNSAASRGGESSWRWQATICAKLPDLTKIEVASTFWEDKKPSHQELNAAYRQNRMSTAAAVRQLHTLKVSAPIFGLVWSDGNVRAHVDWWDKEKGVIVSAPYHRGTQNGKRRTSIGFHEWDLEKPADIIEVYLLLRNLDQWTVGKFRRLVKSGIKRLAEDVEEKGRKVQPWRRRGTLAVGSPIAAAESISSPVKRSARTQSARKKT